MGGWDFDQGNRDSLVTGGNGERGAVAQGKGVIESEDIVLGGC